MYKFEEFPKWIYSEIKKEMIIVKDAIEEAFHRKPPESPEAAAPKATDAPEVPALDANAGSIAPRKIEAR